MNEYFAQLKDELVEQFRGKENIESLLEDGYVVQLKNDLAEQFRGKENIDALVEVVGIELQAVFEFYCHILLDRSLGRAEGAQLDGVGDVVGLTRREAGLLAHKAESEMDDDLYRQYLIYKILKNTCDCTYRALMTAIDMFWPRQAPIQYEEDENWPATIILNIEGFGEYANVYDLLRVPLIRAAGVGLRIKTYSDIKAQLYLALTHNQIVDETNGIYEYELGNVLVMPNGDFITMPDGSLLGLFD